MFIMCKDNEMDRFMSEQNHKTIFTETNESCNFCGKESWEVMCIIRGPDIYICDECVEKCNQIILDQSRKRRRGLIRQEMSEDREAFRKEYYHMWN